MTSLETLLKEGKKRAKKPGKVFYPVSPRDKISNALGPEGRRPRPPLPLATTLVSCWLSRRRRRRRRRRYQRRRRRRRRRRRQLTSAATAATSAAPPPRVNEDAALWQTRKKTFSRDFRDLRNSSEMETLNSPKRIN